MKQFWFKCIFAIVLQLTIVGCTRKKALQKEVSPQVTPVRAEPPSLLKMVQEGPRVGLPAGCVMQERIQSAVIPRETIFFAPDEPRDEIILMQPGEPKKLGIASLIEGTTKAMFLAQEEHPSFFAATRNGWLQLLVPPQTPGQSWIVRENGEAETAVQGENLEAIDLRCRGEHCAAMSTRAMRVAAAGATVLRGQGGQRMSAWKRSDYTPEGAELERPFVLAAVEAERTIGTTVSASGVRFFDASSEEAKPGVFLAAPYGALDALWLKRPIVVAHGAKLVGDCAKPRPFLAIQREGAEAIEIPTDAPPLALFARPLVRGAFVLWLVPTYCGDKRRRIAYAALLNEEGGLRSGPMAMTEATGIALATHGERADVWLRREDRLLWLRLRCEEPQ